MRGIVTLAAALAIPIGGSGGAGFPHRDLVVFTAFFVVLGTLVLQGMTLRPLLNLLRLEDDGSVEREVRLARVETLRAALAAAAQVPDQGMSGLLRRRYQVMLQRAEAVLASDGQVGHGEGSTNGADDDDADAAVVRAATSAERHRLVQLRADGTIGDAAFQQIEQELDLKELDLQQFTPGAASGVSGISRRRRPDQTRVASARWGRMYPTLWVGRTPAHGVAIGDCARSHFRPLEVEGQRWRQRVAVGASLDDGAAGLCGCDARAGWRGRRPRGGGPFDPHGRAASRARRRRGTGAGECSSGRGPPSSGAARCAAGRLPRRHHRLGAGVPRCLPPALPPPRPQWGRGPVLPPPRRTEWRAALEAKRPTGESKEIAEAVTSVDARSDG